MSTHAIDGEEGILSDHLIGGGSWTWIDGKNAIFRGTMSTNSEGVSLIQVFLPRLDRYLNGYIGVSVEAPLTVRRKDRGQLRLPKEGERKEFTFRLAPGQIIRGKILNLEGDDYERLFVQFLLPGEEKKERKAWTNLPDVKPDGTFESDPAPLAPLMLRIEHRRRKYLPYDQRLEPPVQGVQQIVLQRDSSFKQQGRAVFTFTNPPAGGKFDHQLRVYSENRKATVGGSSNSSDVNPQKMDLAEGSYQVFVASLDQDQPLWARASFTVTDTGTTEVPLTLQPSCTVRFRVREKATGKPPGVDDLFLHCDVMIGDKPVDFIGKKMGYGKTKTTTPGEYVFTTVPAGTIRLRVEGGMRGLYQDAVQIVTVTPDQETSVEILLEAAPKDE